MAIMTKQSLYLSYAGLIPFILIPLYVATDNLAIFEGVSYFNQYSAIILSFLGGIHWYQSVENHKVGHQLYFSMLPSITAWLSLIVIPPGYAIVSIGLAHLLVLIYDSAVLKASKPYMLMRTRITSIVIGSHMMLVWQFFFTKDYFL